MEMRMLVAGLTQTFADTIRPAMEVVRVREGLHKVSGCHAMITPKAIISWRITCEYRAKSGPGGDRAVDRAAGRSDVEPDAAPSSLSSFASARHLRCEKVPRARELLHRADPTLMVDGELMADDAVPTDLEQRLSFSQL